MESISRFIPGIKGRFARVPGPSASPPAVQVHLTAADLATSLATDVRQALTASPKRIPPRWLYDPVGL